MTNMHSLWIEQGSKFLCFKQNTDFNSMMTSDRAMIFGFNLYGLVCKFDRLDVQGRVESFYQPQIWIKKVTKKHN